jgi:aminoglycoside phosphotransferase (APT) family kinase protein
VLIAGGRVPGLVDWSGAAEGDPRYDLARATRPKPAAFRDPADLEAFYAGYGAAPLPEPERAYFVDLYELF